MAKVLILGSNGLLGQNLVKKFISGNQIIAASIEDESFISGLKVDYHPIDLSKRRETREFIEKVSPEIIINAAAYTDVDKCEDDPQTCWAANVRAVENILEGAKNLKPVFVQISTDYVFNGQTPPYGEKHPPDPISVYGRSKLAAENIIKSCPFEYQIIRTQILFGNGARIRKNFVTWVIEQLQQGNKINVVDDQAGSPTYAPDLCEAISRLLEKEAFGLFHVSSESSVSRFEFANLIAEVFNLDKSLLHEINTNQLKQKAPRPKNSTFKIDKLVNYSGWQPHSLEDALKLLKKEMMS
ncbi:MAG: dTDP-4-dehydrorhamnose reductase [Calditrichaceae bacterium]|nr:dTDP-4-dehydrorhamnose reductase [Calditrichaceae bacterium]MBN2709190.1 dTDP-4-dehydrorhamnose reductase [Calditrichaceae bacterium]RQV96146.1 MAG: dTDP-4-dehydrorhamnose reductase [Calditrichota bacterium]